MTKQERVAMGHRLRQQRTLLGLTREEFAELADISAGYYGQIEVGTSQMSIDTLIKLSKTSQLSMEYILLGHATRCVSCPDGIRFYTYRETRSGHYEKE